MSMDILEMVERAKTGDADAIRKLLSIPEEENIMAVIAVGKAAEAPFRPKRKAVEDVLTIC